MTTVIGDTDYSNRRLSARAIIAKPLPKSFTLGDMIRVTSDKLSRQVASKILEEDAFFKTETYRYGGTEMLAVQLDAYVLTEDEYIDLMKKQFIKGMEHARGFMPYDSQD